MRGALGGLIVKILFKGRFQEYTTIYVPYLYSFSINGVYPTKH